MASSITISATASAPDGTTCDLSVIVVVPDEGSGLETLVSQIRDILHGVPRFEIIVARPHTEGRDQHEHGDAVANQYGVVEAMGYGDALRAAFARATGSRIVTVDADHADAPGVLADLWAARDKAEVVIASRYVPGAAAVMPLHRLVPSRALNLVFSRGLDLNVRDMSSGFRLYPAHIVKTQILRGEGYDVLQELLVRALLEGYRVLEIPFVYRPSGTGHVVRRLTGFGRAYVKTFARLWLLRNSIASADYDARAYDALMPPQRYWQRQRYAHITSLLRGQPRCLDAGCGSSRIIGALPPGSVALDITARKLRFSRRYGKRLVQGSVLELPVRTNAFRCVLCSQVIEHIPRTTALDELDRVLQPGGLLILGTPDYANWQWRAIERLYKILLPQAYGDEHITHYTRQELVDEFVRRRGYTLEATRYILKGELILALRKPDGQRNLA